jgi:cytoskeletal protein RodZ
VSIGDTLAKARRRAGLTVADVSQRTRIRESIIRGIEGEDFTACGGDFYARGHIRSIAGTVGTDPAPLITEYDAEHGPLGTMRAAEVFEPSTPIKIRERRPPSLSLIVALVLLAIIGFGAYRLVGSHHSTAKPPASPAHRATAVANPKPHNSPTPSPASPAVVIKLTAVQDCWVQITRGSDGSQIYLGTVPAGSSMTWREKHAVQIQLGNPLGVILTVNGKHPSINTPAPLTLTFTPTPTLAS